MDCELRHTVFFSLATILRAKGATTVNDPTVRPLSSQREKNRAFCRRLQCRSRLSPSRVLCWTRRRSPQPAGVIELDVRGARLVLPFRVRVGQPITVSLADELGFHQTCSATVVWVDSLERAGRTMVGVAFSQELSEVA